tara:strand:- start:278 stop:1411 length:1134 start_codon:yes stop_codon:yes gene_type:complete
VKKKILKITTTLDPSFGGPSKGVINTAIHLVKRGYYVDIVTIDKNKFNLKELKKKIRIVNFKKYIGNNYRFSLDFFFWLIKNRNKYEYFVVHGLWQFPTLAARLLIKKKYYVYTHGQLDPYFALDIKKKIKKILYWLFVEHRNLENSRSILLTTLGEKLNLNKTFVNTKRIKKKVTEYGIYPQKKFDKQKVISKFYKKFKFLKNKNFFLFLGRIDEKKGCDIIIEAVKKLKNKLDSLVIIVGPAPNKIYKNKLINLVKSYNLTSKIYFFDPLYGNLKWVLISLSKAMLLPSHGENFGIALVESLSMAKPVITSNKVNIYKDILNYKCGLISNDNIDSFSRKLLILDRMNINEYSSLSINAKKCFNEKFNLSKLKFVL